MSSMSAALVGNGGLLFRRQRDRLQSERIPTTEQQQHHDVDDDDDDEEGSFINSHNTTTTTITTREEMAAASDVEEAAAVSEGGRAQRQQENSRAGGEEDEDSSDEEEDVEAAAPPAAATAAGVSHFTVRPGVTLRELEEEREAARRRSSACILFALFVLFRLWVLALQEADFGLLLLCLVGTSWTARWIRYNRDQEEELDRRIANFLENNNNENGGGGGENGAGGEGAVGRDDLRMLSFQAQLALAIMESQRQMMQGGYGHPDGDNHNATPGVSDHAKSAWTKFHYKAARDRQESRRGSNACIGAAAGGGASGAGGGYGTVKSLDDDDDDDEHNNEPPHCSICLGEYEEGEELTKLPCGHIYHDECIDSWCSNHIRCPLCNYDLETGAPETV